MTIPERDAINLLLESVRWLLSYPDRGRCDRNLRDLQARLEGAKPPLAEPSHIPPEFCICAAIRMPDGEVIHGHRHNHCYDVVRARFEVSRADIVKAEQGFVTSTGRFVNRVEAMAIQKDSGLALKPRSGTGGELLSEDLY